MKGKILGIFIIGLTLLIFSLSTSGHGGVLYRCVNSEGTVMLTDNVPTDPAFDCIFAAAYRELTPQERAQEKREVDTIRRQARADVEKHEANEKRRESERLKKQQANIAKEEENRRANQASELASKRKERMDKTDKLSKEYWDRSKKRSPKEEKRLQAEYSKAVSDDPRTIESTLIIKRVK